MKRVVLPLMAVAILAACGGGDDSTGQSTSPSQPAAAPSADAGDTPEPAPESEPADAPATPATPAPGNDTAPAADVPEALKLSAPLVGGGDIELTTLAGRPVLLWFWAPW